MKNMSLRSIAWSGMTKLFSSSILLGLQEYLYIDNGEIVKVSFRVPHNFDPSSYTNNISVPAEVKIDIGDPTFGG
jgi:hypothetical protein